jgi:Flp pilus assembly protein TadD
MKRIVHTSLVFLLAASAASIAAQAPAQPAAPGKPADSPAMEVVKQARELSSQGKQDEAIAAYQRALVMSPQLAEAESGIGAAFDLKGDYVQARQHFSKALAMAAPEAQPQVPPRRSRAALRAVDAITTLSLLPTLALLG